MRIVGLVCAAFSVGLLAWEIVEAIQGGSSGLMRLGLALALLLVAVLTLRPRRARA